MYTAKHALLYKRKVPDGRAYIFYMDIRAGGKGYEEFIRRVMEEERVLYIRGRVAKVILENGKLLVEGIDTLSGQRIEIAADMVVLAMAIVSNSNELVQKLRVATDEYGFAQEAHPKLRPVETLTSGVFVAGVIQGPKDIPETVAQASGAAAKALTLLAKDVLEREPTIAQVNEQTCVGCFDCQRVCPYGAIERREIRDRQGNLIKVVARVNEGICEGCGACVVACKNKSMDLAGFAEEQIFAELAAVM
jgi:heterodisulfide reductase subunit A